LSTCLVSLTTTRAEDAREARGIHPGARNLDALRERAIVSAEAPYRDPNLPTGDRVADLLDRMTLEEKLAQLGAVWAQAVMEGDGFSPDKAREVLARGTGHITRIGARTLLGPRASARLVNDIQRHLALHTRLGIPAIVHEESCAGYTARGATQFPQAIGLASTWEPDLIEAMAGVIRTQMRAVGARQTLAPVLDIARDPRWGRAEETFGEDAYLAARMGVAYVRGIQADSLRDGVAATAKHFMGYGASEGGLNWAPAPLPRRELLERILPPFAAAIREAGLASIMNAYQEIDGVPCGASKWLLDGLLRGALGFDGVVVADYYTVLCLMTYHRIATDKSEAAARALEAGLDVELPQLDCFGEPLAEAVAKGRIDLADVDRSVARVLRMKFDLGLFEEATVDPDVAPAVFDTAPQRALAREIARKSVVLLKNEGGVLPLDPALGKIAVIGPNADSIRHLQGDYHYPTHLELVFGAMDEGNVGGRVEAESDVQPGERRGDVDLLDFFTPTVTILAGIRDAVSAATEIRAARGCKVRGEGTADVADAVAAARGADAAIVVVGGRSGLTRGCTSGEANDRADVVLPGVQADLVAAVAETGVPTVLVIVGGRPLALANVAARVPAILEAWLTGEEGGHAVADILFGRAAPGGRLPVTLPRAVGQLPLYYNHKPSGARSQFWGDYADLPTSPLFPFGHGLAYTTFEYGNLALSSRSPATTDTLQISFDVSNTGDRAGDEVAQLYVCDRVASVTRPVKELKGFQRLALEPGETRRVTFSLDLGQLAFYDRDMRYVVEPGEVAIWVGSSSEDLRLESSIVVSGERRRVDPAAVKATDVAVH
jgi:beta-glucosidase